MNSERDKKVFLPPLSGGVYPTPFVFRKMDCNERSLYISVVDLFERLHDVRVVQSSEVAEHGVVQQAVAALGDSFQLGHRAD